MTKPLTFDASKFTIALKLNPLQDLRKDHHVFKLVGGLRRIPGVSNAGEIKSWWTTSHQTGNVVTVQEVQYDSYTETSFQYLNIGKEEFRDIVEGKGKYPNPESLTIAYGNDLFVIADTLVELINQYEVYKSDNTEDVDSLEDFI